MTEHEHQRELFSWANTVSLHGWEVANEWMNTHPVTMKRLRLKDFVTGRGKEREPCSMLRWLHAIPNGGSRGGDARGRRIQGARMKAEGVKAGVPDIFLPLPLRGFNGLYIELKKVQKGKLSNEQNTFEQHCKDYGYLWVCCRGYLEAVNLLVWYCGKG